MEIRFACMRDFDMLKKFDKHISEDMLITQIEAKHIMMSEIDSIFIGWLRYNFFWDSVPFMNMLFLLDEYRGKGYGSELVSKWESEMKKQGFDQVMTSTQANECSQHFYRKQGYEDIGGFIPFGESFEIIFAKKI